MSEIIELEDGNTVELFREHISFFDGNSGSAIRVPYETLKIIYNKAFKIEEFVLGHISDAPMGLKEIQELITHLETCLNNGTYPDPALNGATVKAMKQILESFEHRDVMVIDLLEELENANTTKEKKELPAPKKERLYSDTYGRWFDNKEDELTFGLGFQQQELSQAKADVEKLKKEYEQKLKRLGEGLDNLIPIASKFVPELKSILDETTKLLTEDYNSDFG